MSTNHLKREIFIWKKDDLKLLREVIHEEPYKLPVEDEPYKFSCPKRGAAWTNIADNLVQRGLVKATQRSVRGRVNSLMEEYHAREKEEKKASGVERVGVAGEGDNNSDNGVSPIKKKSSHTNLVSMMEASTAMKKNEREEHRQVRNRKLELRAAEMQQQRQFQTMLLHQQQHYEQQQEALNMAMLNTMNELLKRIKNP
ncbi:hypothetical protein AWC38_SpisGene16915 [Stylophora pistillata]|uniref:Uncharacterized protein n=1 Tax=Stylophora pistillata TaxID=50429 RepID=A0A2B4RPG8_STYPI|nr:hypothetical protein AWC38_SpisGene16915 [Stylophora pistillata]